MKESVKILVVQALPEEYAPTPLPCAEVKHLYTGVGKVNAAVRLMKAIHEWRPDVVLNVGTAGTAIHRVGDILLCTRFMDRDLRVLADFGVVWQQDTGNKVDAFPWDWGLPVGALCNTGDSFVTDAAHAEGDVVDMEAYAEAQACQELGIPFLAVKYVTDVVGQNSVKHWEDKLADARRDLAAYFAKITLKDTYI